MFRRSVSVEGDCRAGGTAARRNVLKDKEKRRGRRMTTSKKDTQYDAIE